eukprot:COSAG04_NODE_4564_length_2016_cov_1.417840_2_plen_56_part_00
MQNGELADARQCLETAHDLKPPKNPLTAAPEMTAAKPYAEEIRRVLKLSKKKGKR